MDEEIVAHTDRVLTTAEAARAWDAATKLSTRVMVDLPCDLEEGAVMVYMCQAGRGCGFGGKWVTPCPSESIHSIAVPGRPPIMLCDQHFQEVAAVGLVLEQNIGKEEFDRREKERRDGL